jgi:3-hydroxyisobutyrate dehydrogenase
MKKNIGWIGTGVMGRSMCGHVLNAGYPVSVFNRTKAKAATLIEQGAKWCDSPGEVAAHSEIVFTIAGYPEDVESLYLGDNGLVQAAKPGSILVDMTTSEPSLAQRIARTAAGKGVESLDAPVSGGDVGARDGKLAIMVGGDKEAFEQVKPLFQLMGENIALMGPAGCGQHTKMSNQILISTTMIGTVESLLYAHKAGLDQDQVIDIIGKGAAASWSLNNLGRRMVKKNFDPGFFIKHFVKDMRIALMEADNMKLALPGLALAKQFYAAAMAMGYENLGTHALYKVFEQLNGETGGA